MFMRMHRTCCGIMARNATHTSMTYSVACRTTSHILGHHAALARTTSFANAAWVQRSAMPDSGLEMLQAVLEML